MANADVNTGRQIDTFTKQTLLATVLETDLKELGEGVSCRIV